MTTSTPHPPAGLSARARRLWKATVEQLELSAAEVELLRQACLALDRADQAAAEIARDGLTVPDRYQCLKAHPAAAVEVRCRSLFANLVRQIGAQLADDVPESPTTRKARAAAQIRWARERGTA